MECLECGNCKGDGLIYYCAAKNEFIIKDNNQVKEKKRSTDIWKKGDPRYETRRRSCKGETIKTG